jgi:hypothetical protein
MPLAVIPQRQQDPRASLTTRRKASMKALDNRSVVGTMTTAAKEKNAAEEAATPAASVAGRGAGATAAGTPLTATPTRASATTTATHAVSILPYALCELSRLILSLCCVSLVIFALA